MRRVPGFSAVMEPAPHAGYRPEVTRILAPKLTLAGLEGLFDHPIDAFYPANSDSGIGKPRY